MTSSGSAARTSARPIRRSRRRTIRLTWARSGRPRPDVIMTATAGNDTVRLLTQLKEYGILSDKLTAGRRGPAR